MLLPAAPIDFITVDYFYAFLAVKCDVTINWSNLHVPSLEVFSGLMIETLD